MPSRVSDTFKSHPVDFTQEYMDFSSMKELPESYAWTSRDHDSPNPCFGTGNIEQTVPLVNLNDRNAPTLVGNACRKWGVFQITNHGIETSLLEGVEAAGKSLFSLPLCRKLKAARLPDGVSGYGMARISSFFPKLMWSEGFTIFGSPTEHARKLWPHDYKKFCDIIEKFENEMQLLAKRLMWLMLGSLGIAKKDVKWASLKGERRGTNAAIQLNSYPTCPDPDRAMGLAPHTDSTLLTILHQNSTSGLQVFKEGYGWVTVKPMPSALVVHVGDLLHIITNGLYPSVLHRAVVNRTEHRFSAAYLFGPPAHISISPLQKLLGPTRPPLYRPITWSEYLSTKAKHFDKALTSVRLCLPVNGFTDGSDNNSAEVV